MGAVEIKPKIYWVGAIDWAVRDFHGYVTPRGTTYNNYLIADTDITLVDSVKHDFTKYTVESIRSVVDPAKIRNIVINHIEPDHASGLNYIMGIAPDAKIYCTDKAKKGLLNYFDEASNWNINVIKTGDKLNTGTKTLIFIESPMLHWPDSMMTYVREDNLLISQDAFGQHIASSERFDDEFIGAYCKDDLHDAVWDYYANILMPFGTLIQRKIEEITGLSLQIDMIAPDHGIIWRADPSYVINEYIGMAGGRAERAIAVIYDTMWHSTELMLGPIVEGIKAAGVNVKVIKLRATPTSIAIKEFWKCRGSLIGSPTLNNTIFPQVAGFIYALKGLRPKNRIVSAFGSYGWAGGAVKDIIEMFNAMKLQTVEPGLGVLSRPSREDEKKCYEFGSEFAEKTIKYHETFV